MRPADKFTQLCFEKSRFFDKFTHIGGSYIGAGLNQWYWLSTGKPVSYNLNWAIGEPNNKQGKENCLALETQNGPFKFNDIHAYGEHPNTFVCESIPKINQIDLRDN